ncbi:MAG: hypothetical protein OSB05_14205 [Akkermansiaceae bacterium]|nr:hypothetical protein [Akkermansiaceae bacterium]
MDYRCSGIPRQKISQRPDIQEELCKPLPEGPLAGAAPLIEQGEVLPRKYGHEGNTHFHLELLTAGLTRVISLRNHRSPPVAECLELPLT